MGIANDENAAKREAARIQALYGENKQITDGNYGKSLAVKCIISPDASAQNRTAFPF